MIAALPAHVSTYVLKGSDWITARMPASLKPEDALLAESQAGGTPDLLLDEITSFKTLHLLRLLTL